MIRKLLFSCCIAVLAWGMGTASHAQSISSVVVSLPGGSPQSGYCSGTTVNVAYSTRNIPAMTNFNIELSNATGSFATPTSLGTTTAASSANVTLPNSLNGTAYKIRVRATVGMTNYSGESTSFSINATPTINSVDDPNESKCTGQLFSAINFSGTNATSFSWTSNANVGFGTSGNGNIASTNASNGGTSNVVATVTATPFNGACAGTATTFTVTAKPRPTMSGISSTSYCNGAAGAAINFSSNIPSTSYLWNSSANVGFGVSGTTNIGGYTATNSGNAPTTASVSVTPSANGCSGSNVNFNVTVNPTPSVSAVSSVTHCGGLVVPGITFSSPTSGVSLNWTSASNVGFGTS
ncbi:MAG: hypothetical protein MUE30_08805, partial [Spirosomaceae bacterium]|nr:hypothetical protein [Spirosomataceae bacterium]